MRRALFAAVVGLPVLLAVFITARLLERLRPMLVEYVASTLRDEAASA